VVVHNADVQHQPLLSQLFISLFFFFSAQHTTHSKKGTRRKKQRKEVEFLTANRQPKKLKNCEKINSQDEKSKRFDEKI
jgi:hypothetical protein